MKETYLNYLATIRGTELHELAAQCIKLGVKLTKSKQTLNMYVNDAIGYHMVPEQPLYYSENCFGTCDAISFSEQDKFLRIHDLKTGKTPASMSQLKVYVALFCLEYDYSPEDLQIELRIYQSSEIIILAPDPEEINFIMDRIKKFDSLIDKLDSENF